MSRRLVSAFSFGVESEGDRVSVGLTFGLGCDTRRLLAFSCELSGFDFETGAGLDGRDGIRLVHSWGLSSSGLLGRARGMREGAGGCSGGCSGLGGREATEDFRNKFCILLRAPLGVGGLGHSCGCLGFIVVFVAVVVEDIGRSSSLDLERDLERVRKR